MKKIIYKGTIEENDYNRVKDIDSENNDGPSDPDTIAAMPKPAIAATMVNDLLRNPPVTAKIPDPASMPAEKRISTKAASPVLPPKCPKVIIGNNAASGENAKAKTNPHQRRANSPLYPLISL